MSVREIITIQCGHYSNFVGTHWWNLQESSFCYESKKEIPEIRHDCMFREGITLNGDQTYVPRLITIDKCGSLRSLKQHGILYEAAQPEGSEFPWEGKMAKHAENPAAKNEFLSDLNKIELGEMKAKEMESKLYAIQDGVKVWSDFLRIHLHPRSVVTIPDVFHEDETSFNVFPAGQASWTSKFQESFEERLHFFLEECDSLQGFHLLADAGDGFGGLASCMAEELADQFSQKALASFMTSPDSVPPSLSPKFRSSVLSSAMCLDELSEHSSLTCPLYLLEQPWRDSTSSSHKAKETLRHKHALPYHSAAIFAAALETASLIYRSYQAPHSLLSMADSLTRRGRKVCAMGLAFPFSLPPESSLLSELDVRPLHTQLMPLTPSCSVTDEFWAQYVSLRGVPSDYPICLKEDRRHAFCSSHPTLALGTHISNQLPECSAHFTVVNKPLVLGNPFPSAVHQSTSREIASCASFQSQSGLHCMMESLSTELKRLDVRLVPSFAESSLSVDDYSELKERLVALGECYQVSRPLTDASDSD